MNTNNLENKRMYKEEKNFASNFAQVYIIKTDKIVPKDVFTPCIAITDFGYIYNCSIIESSFKDKQITIGELKIFIENTKKEVTRRFHVEKQQLENNFNQQILKLENIIQT